MHLVHLVHLEHLILFSCIWNITYLYFYFYKQTQATTYSYSYLLYKHDHDCQVEVSVLDMKGYVWEVRDYLKAMMISVQAYHLDPKLMKRRTLVE